MEFNLQEEIQSLAEPELYQIPNELDVESLGPRELDDALEAAIETISRSSEAIAQADAFDVYRSLIRHLPLLAPPLLSKIVDSLVSAFAAEIDAVTRDIDAVASHLPGSGVGVRAGDDDEDEEDRRQAYLGHRQPLEMYAFLLMWFVEGAEKLGSGKGGGATEEAVAPRGKGKGGKGKASKAAAAQTFSWPAHIPLVLSSFHKALRIRTERIWTTTQEREAFVGCFTKPAYQIAETEAHLKSMEVRLGVYKVICLAVKFHGAAFGAQTTIMQNLTYFEHMSEPMAELLTILEKEFDHTQVTEEILREISTKHFVAQDAKGPRSIGRFLVKLAELSPRLVLKQMSLLQAHLDCEAYLMRMAIIEILGTLIKDIALSDEGDEAQKKKQIKTFFELLFERCLDLNSWVRGKVMQTLIKLCDLPNKFPKQRQRMTEMSIRSLEDKTSSVRKHSIQLICKLVETHPFGALHGGTLNLGEWQERYDKVAEELKVVDLKEMEKARADAGMDDDEEEAASKRSQGGEGEEEEGADADQSGASEAIEADEGEDASKSARVKQERPSRRKERAESQAPDLNAISNEQANMDSEAIMRLRLTKKYYTDALLFINQIETAIPTLSQLLVSTTKSEVLESMRFFRTAYEYNFQSAEIGIKTMIHLIWTKDNNAIVEDGTEVKGIRSNLIDVYKTLYFDVVPDLEPKQQVNRIAKNMIERTYGATLAELTSLEELMRTMMMDNGVHPDVINKLWQVYGTHQEIPKAQRRGAIIILGMLAVAKREVVTERVETLLSVGLGPLGKADLQLARYTCVALQRLSGSTKKVKGSLADKGTRLSMDSLIFTRLQQVIEMSTRSSYWFGVAEQAINTIYLLGEQPDMLCGTIIKNLHTRAFAPPASAGAPDEDEAGADVQHPVAGPSSPRKDDASAPATSKRKASSFKLAQLVFVVGHVAIKHIVYLELVEREFKRRKDETAKANAAAKPVDKDGNDLDAVAGNAEDDIGDLIATIRERELLYGEYSLLATYGPLIAHICATPKVYRFPALRQAAALAMTKLMCVSAQYCEEHLLLLFKILETSKDPIIRSNIVIALGDIAVCFGSIIDDNSERLYEGLTDSNLVVKKNTLMVLTHLILNGMIKVKGQLGEMAKCLEDAEPRISDLAKLFFTELSTKDNALYNNLQDVISHLSTGAHAVDEETFERTMRFIFTFIEKEKQAESIVEKLCQRFRLATDERQWRDIAFCLSLLPFKSDKSMKRLIEGLPFYQDKLHEETVYRRFNEILTKARSNKQSNKPETELKEFEAILAEHRAKGEEDQALEADVARKAAKAKRRAAKAAPAPAVKAARPARKGARRRAVSEETEASSIHESEDADE